LKRKPDGDHERALVLRLNAQQQARQPGAALSAGSGPVQEK
jgi:hypothetical protein